MFLSSHYRPHHLGGTSTLWPSSANSTGNPDFWLHCGGTDIPRITAETKDQRAAHAHVAFNANTRAEVDDWYKLAVKAGGIPNGEPGERPYVPGYYAAYVLDPVGNNIEVCAWKPGQKA